MSLLEKVAVITGGTRGLGWAIARVYAQEGASVVVASRSTEAVEHAVRSLQEQGARVSGRACDVGELAQVEVLAQHALDTWGHLDIWVNNAGIAGPYGPTAHITPQDFVQVTQTNVLGVYHGSWTALQHFLPQGRGKLINVLGAGARRPTPMQNAYGSSKVWARNFTLALAKEYRDSGVGIFALHPGLMHTDLVHHIRVVEGYEERIASFATVLRFLANSPDIPARKAVWLASSATDGRTGLEVQATPRAGLLVKLLRELLLREAPTPPAEIDVKTIPPARSDLP